MKGPDTPRALRFIAVLAPKDDPLKNLLPAIAILISLVSAVVAVNTSRKVAVVDTTTREYALYYNLAKLQIEEPLMAHLFATTSDDYTRAYRLAAQIAEKRSHEDRLMLSAEEVAIANYIFTAFEETFYHWYNAVQSGDEAVAALYGDHLIFFGEQLCNSRLQWLWDDENGRAMSDLFSERAKNYYTEHVKNSCSMPPDSIGPL